MRNEAWDFFDCGHPVAKLCHGLRQDNLVVESLETVRLSIAERSRGCDNENGRPISKRRCQTGEAIRKTRIVSVSLVWGPMCRKIIPAIGGDEAYTRVSAELGISLGGLNGGGLVASVKKINTNRDAAHKEGIEVTAV